MGVGVVCGCGSPSEGVDWRLRGRWYKNGVSHHWEIQAVADLLLY